MAGPIFSEDSGADRPDDHLAQLIRDNDAISRRARSMLSRFESAHTIGAGEGRGIWGDTWLTLAVGRWGVLVIEMAGLGLAVLLLLGGRVGLLPSVADSGLLLAGVTGLFVVAVCVGFWAKLSLGGWIDEHNARVERLRREVKAQREGSHPTAR